MFKITDFTQTETGAVQPPHLYITLTGRGVDLGPVSPALLAELTAAVEAATDQYADMAAAWANAHGKAICLDLAMALEESGCTNLVYDAQAVRFAWHGAQFELVRRGVHLELTWEYPVLLPWQFRDYNLADHDFASASIAEQVLADLAGLVAEYPPLPDDPTPNRVEKTAAVWIWRRLDTGSSLAAPEISAIFTGKFEYQPVRIPVLVLEILRQAEKCRGELWSQRRFRVKHTNDAPRFAKWYLAYGQYLREPEPAAAAEPPAPTSIFLQ